MQDWLRRARSLAGFPGMELSSRLLGRRRPLLAGYKVTHRCNLTCVHCPFWKRDAKQLGYDGARATIDRLYAGGARLLVFEGGEPTLWRDGGWTLNDLIAHAKRRFWSVGVTTNGTHPLPAEADVIWVSVDGLKDTTARIRGPIFGQQMAHIAACRHPRLFANITVSALNAGEVPALVERLAGCVRGITIQFYYPFEGDRGMAVPEAERVALLDRLLSMKRDGYPLLDSERALAALRRPGHGPAATRPGRVPTATRPGWRCHPWLVTSAEPDGRIQQGCYLLGRGPVACDQCGFAAHVEMSLAYDLHPGAILAGMRIFGLLPMAA